MEPATITVGQVQDVLDDIMLSQRYKPDDESLKPIDHANLFLKALLSLDVLGDPIAYRIIQQLAIYMKDGLFEQCGGDVFETVDRLFIISDTIQGRSPQFKTIIQEIATALFSHACSVVQGNPNYTVTYLPYLLKAMLREGGNKWNAYSCCGPLLMTRLEVFQPHASLLLQVMPSFPETLSVIHDLYQLAPSAFIENMPLLVKLYESNVNGQLSILDIVRDLAKTHPEIVAPHLAALQRIARGAKNDDAEVVMEIEANCANSIKEAAPQKVPDRGNDEVPDDFDERVEYLNKLTGKCHDVQSFRAFLTQNDHAIRYLRHVAQVMPLPIGIDYGMHATETNLKASGGSGGKRRSWRNSSRGSPQMLKDSKGMFPEKEALQCGMFASCFDGNGEKDGFQEFIMLRFLCTANGPHCATRNHPILIRANIPPPWIKLGAVLFALSPPNPPLNIQIRKWTAHGDTLDALLEIAQGVEMAAAAAKRESGGKAVDGFEVLTCPFLGTDDLGDLIVDLRTEGLFSVFSFDVATNAWACSACSGGAAQKANVSGYLAKKGRRLGRYVKRYYMLDENHLFYAKSDHASKPKRRIPVLDIVSVHLVPENNIQINIRDEKRSLSLRAPSIEAAQRWSLAIQALIDKQNM